MQNIFGIPMTSILVVVVAIMGLCLLTTALIAWRNPVVFRMALRNVPRRRAQSILIMVGLMLSTMIISAALTTGDSLDNSFKQAAYDGLGQVDQTIAYSGEGASDSSISVASPVIRASIADDLEAYLQNDPDVDAIMPVLTIAAPVLHQGQGLNEPAVIVTGMDPARISGFGGFISVNGDAVDGSHLPAGSAMISEDLATRINASEGDTITFFHQNQPHTVEVAAVVQGSILTGFESGTDNAGPAQMSTSRLVGLAVDIRWLQEITGMEGQARFIAVSNTGDARSGVERTDAAVAALSTALTDVEGGSQLGINPIKRDAINSAEILGNTFMTFFVILGMFSISAGILLIFLIFMMLAAERRAEMGMARAVGMKQRHLVQGFIAEGAAYAYGAGLLGTLLGIGAAALITTLISTMSADNVSISPYLSIRSLAIAYALGVTITFLTVIFASVRSCRLNIVAAIRDLPEEQHRSRNGRPRWTWHAARRQGTAQRVMAIIMSPCIEPVRALIFGIRLAGHYLGGGPMIAIPGALLTALGISATSMFIFSFGLSTLVLGIALFLSNRLPARAVYTSAAGLMLLYWLLPMSFTQRFLPDVGDGGPEMFFVSGIFMVTYSTMIVMWNAGLLVRLVSLAGRRLARWLPAVKTAVAYPLASRGRTGLTLAMFSMVIFALVTVRTISGNFSELLRSDDARAGWDVVLISNPSNPIGNLDDALAGSDVSIGSIAATGTVDAIDPERSQVRNPGEDSWKRYLINGMDNAFIATTEAGFEARAPGFDSDDAIWNRLLAGERIAIIDVAALDDDEFGGNVRDYLVPDNIRLGDGTIPAFSIELRNPQTGSVETIPVAGVISARASTLGGIYLPEAVFSDIYGTPDASRVYIQMSENADVSPGGLAQQIESTLQSYGVQASSIREQIEEQQVAANSFFMMLQGFMGLGLLVGIAALGVISFRSVVERRQQIGMLRAIGYRRNMVALSFLLESLVIAAIGVITGAALALVLCYNLIMDEGIDGTAFERFVVPWGTIGLFIGLSLVAAMVMTWIPARRAASVPIADALRYE